VNARAAAVDAPHRFPGAHRSGEELLAPPSDTELDLPGDSFAGCLASGWSVARPLPGVAPLRNRGTTRNSRSALVVPSHPDGLLRATGAGVLQPAPDEVRRVSDGHSVSARSVARSRPRQERTTSPRRTSHPSKNLQPARSRARATHPTKQPHRVSATVAPLPFSRLRGFAPLRGPASRTALAGGCPMLVLPWV
jgi:hypothetical protein